MYMWIHVCMTVYAHMCMHIYMYIYIYIYICMCVCVCLYICVYMHVYIYIYIYVCKWLNSRPPPHKLLPCFVFHATSIGDLMTLDNIFPDDGLLKLKYYSIDFLFVFQFFSIYVCVCWYMYYIVIFWPLAPA